jgi:hypothetical protein
MAGVWRRTGSCADPSPRPYASKVPKPQRPAAPHRPGAGLACGSGWSPSPWRAARRVGAGRSGSSPLSPTPRASARCCAIASSPLSRRRSPRRRPTRPPWHGPRPHQTALLAVSCGPVVAAVRPLRVTPAACGEHACVRAVSRSTRRSVSGQTGGVSGQLSGVGLRERDQGVRWTPRKICFKLLIRRH